MKINGKFFKKGMTNNSVRILGDSVAIHSSNGDNGIFRKVLNMSELKEGDDSSFNLSQKDFNLLSNFGELIVRKKDDKITFLSENAKFNIQDYEHSFTTPSRDSLKELNLPREILEKASHFADSKRAESAGILIYPSCIVGTSGNILYKCKIETHSDLIHIPLNFLKILDNEEYQFTSSDKFIFANKSGEIAYSALYEQKLGQLDKFEPMLNGCISCDMQELKNILQTAKNFSDYVFLIISKDNSMIVESIVDVGQNKKFSAAIKLTSNNIHEYKKAVTVNNLLKILSIDTNHLKIDNRSILAEKDTEFATTAIYTQPNERDLQLKEEEN